MQVNYVDPFFNFIADLMHTVAAQSGDAIRQAAEMVADAIQNDHDFFLFGSGHSGLVAHEGTGRAGGLAPAIAIQDVADGDAERLEGMAALILGRYDLRTGSVIIVISQSGINAVPVEVALLCKAAGLHVIALTSLAHSQLVAARHSSGKKLYEIADLVIDTHNIPGDVALQLPNSSLKSGAPSTIIGAMIIEAITVQAAALLAERGLTPPVFISSNVPGGDAHNQQLVAHYRPRMVRYQVPVLVGTSLKASEASDSQP